MNKYYRRPNVLKCYDDQIVAALDSQTMVVAASDNPIVLVFASDIQMMPATASDSRMMIVAASNSPIAVVGIALDIRMMVVVDDNQTLVVVESDIHTALMDKRSAVVAGILNENRHLAFQEIIKYSITKATNLVVVDN
jgi:hypothetical protein